MQRSMTPSRASPKGHDFVIGRDQKPSVARTMSLTGG
jgi:hypothetical protein